MWGLPSESRQEIRLGRLVFGVGGAARAARGSDLSFENEKNGGRRRKSDPRSVIDIADKPHPRKKGAAPADVGNALRSVYQRTIDESIPPDLLDLLGKLG